jgi:hypothetical protein
MSPIDSCFEVKACSKGGKVALDVSEPVMGEILFPNPVNIFKGQIFDVNVFVNNELVENSFVNRSPRLDSHVVICNGRTCGDDGGPRG